MGNQIDIYAISSLLVCSMEDHAKNWRQAQRDSNLFFCFNYDFKKNKGTINVTYRLNSTHDEHTGEIDTAKEFVEKTAETVEKVAEMTEKMSKEASNQLQDGKLKEAVEVVEKVSKMVEEDARLVEDILHKVQF